LAEAITDSTGADTTTRYDATNGSRLGFPGFGRIALQAYDRIVALVELAIGGCITKDLGSGNAPPAPGRPLQAGHETVPAGGRLWRLTAPRTGPVNRTNAWRNVFNRLFTV